MPRILLVDDDAETCTFLEELPAAPDRQFVSVQDPDTALVKIRQDVFDLLISDMVMPEKSGKLLAQQFRQEKPQLLVLFISGYAPDRSEFGDAGFLQKGLGRGAGFAFQAHGFGTAPTRFQIAFGDEYRFLFVALGGSD